MNATLINLNSRKLAILLLGVLFSMSLTAQVLIPAGLTIPDDITAYTLSWAPYHDAGPTITEGTGGWAIEYTNGDDYLEFQILASESGQYALTAPISTGRTDGYINVTAYKADDEFVMNDDATVYAYNNEWQSPVNHIFAFNLEADVTYNLRLTFVGNGSNLFIDGFAIDALIGSADATLSDLQIDGATITDFDPATLSYTVAMKPYDWINTITATANDASATISLPEKISYPEEGVYDAEYEVSVTSESGVVKVYTIKVNAPIEIHDLLDWDLEESFTINNVYYSSRADLRSWGVMEFANAAYFDFYVYSAWDANYDVRVNYSDGNGEGSEYPDAMSYLNVSTLEVDDTTWMLNDLYTKYLAPTYYAGNPVPSWDYNPRQDQDFVISLKEDEPVLLRFYSILDGGKGPNIQEMGFTEISGSIDATLSELKVDGTSVIDFDPMTTTYNVALPIGASTATTSATANDANSTITGAGVVDIVGTMASDTITVISESGFDINYIINFYTPIAIDFTLEDSFSIAMYTDMFYNGGANVSNTLINKSYDNAYVEYYIYSEEDKDVHLVANMSNGNPDTVSCEMNVSTYTYGTEWVLDGANTRTVPHSDSMFWDAGHASDIEYNLSLTAGEAVMLRLFFITDGTLGSGDIQSLILLDGLSSASSHSIDASDVKIYGGSSSLTVELDAYVGSSVKVFDITGRVIINTTANSSKEVYSVNENGIYIVRAVDANNNITTVKCIVK